MGRFNEEPEILTTDERYGFIAGIVKEVHTTAIRQRIDISRNVDLVLTNRFVGFPIFIIFIWAMFQITFTLGEYPMGWIDNYQLCIPKSSPCAICRPGKATPICCFTTSRTCSMTV